MTLDKYTKDGRLQEFMLWWPIEKEHVLCYGFTVDAYAMSITCR